MTCSELQLLPQYIDSRDRDVEQTVYDLGFTPSEVTTSTINKTITYNSSAEKLLHQPGIGSAAEVYRGDFFEIPITGSVTKYSYSMIDSRIGEIYGMYSEIDVQFNASDSYTDNGFRVGIDSSGNGYYSVSHVATISPSQITYDTRITTGKTYKLGWCLLPVNVLLPPNNDETVVWRYTAWIEGEDLGDRMTYGVPRKTAVKGNVTIKSAKRGLTKKEVPCSTCVESSDLANLNCSACSKTKTPIPLVTLTGFDNGINGSYSIRSYATHQVTPLLKVGAVGIDFGGGAYCRYAMEERQNLGTMDAQWPLVVNHDRYGNYHLPHYDSTLLDGDAGLSCRKVEYVVGTQDHTCYECGTRYYDEPSAISAALRMEVIYHVKPLVVEMGVQALPKCQSLVS